MEYVNQELVQQLETLCNKSGLPGNESSVRKVIRKYLEAYGDHMRVDAIGNLYVEKKAKGNAKLRVMIAAHMDEVGFMVVNSSDDEFYEFRVLGGIDPRVLPAKSVLIGKNGIRGVISPRTAHLTKAEERKQVVSVEQLRINVGKENTGKINAGDYVSFDTQFSPMGEGFVAKALDDRVGCVNLIWLLQHAPEDIDVIGVFTVQEELGLRGATIAANQVKPDIALVLDTTPSIDPPLMDSEDENTFYNTRLGHGPVVYTVDRGQIHDPRYIKYIVDIAEDMKIPYQKRQPGGGGTDGSAIHLQASGIPCQSVSVPVRYLHTPRSFMRLDDWNHTLQLLHATLTNISANIFDEERK